ncbi:MAG: RDD family protein [Cytophagaceae bacterium]|nr:RDD family protein [Cytophagaceae bacterium]
METIDINTPQNVTINYELASLWDRIFAFVIDFIIVSLTTLIIYSGQAFNVIFIILALAFFLLYSLLFELMNNGKSLGKMILGLKVMKTEGTQAIASDYLARWVFRSLELYMTAGLFAAIMVSLSDKNQRLGDLVANTVVVKERPSFSMSLVTLLNKKTLNDYQPKYLAVANMSEEDALFIKEVLERYRKYNNEAHRDALKILADKMKAKLNITTSVGKYDEFLLTLIKDYVVLTR